VIVANSGPLVDPTDTYRIFEPFQRLAERTSHEGFGLGLAIVASSTAVHNGSVTARPRDGGGLIVTVSIPSAGVSPPGAELGSPAGSGRDLDPTGSPSRDGPVADRYFHR
jgi:K+-sensing histidine kinase KdpD